MYVHVTSGSRCVMRSVFSSCEIIVDVCVCARLRRDGDF